MTKPWIALSQQPEHSSLHKEPPTNHLSAADLNLLFKSTVILCCHRGHPTPSSVLRPKSSCAAPPLQRPKAEALTQPRSRARTWWHFLRDFPSLSHCSRTSWWDQCWHTYANNPTPESTYWNHRKGCRIHGCSENRTGLAWFRVKSSVTTAFCGGWKIPLLINNLNMSMWSEKSKYSWAAACSNRDLIRGKRSLYHCCCCHISLPQESQCTGNRKEEKNPQDILSQQKLLTSFPKLLSRSAAQQEQLQLFLEHETCSPSLRSHRMPRPGTAVLNRTETSSTTQSSGAAGLCNTTAPSHSNENVFSLLQHKAGHPEKLLTLVFSNLLTAFFRELNGPQCPSSETCTLSWVLLTPAHRQGKERSGFNPATDAFGSLLSHAAGSTPKCFPSCYRSLHWLSTPCTQSSPIQSPFSRKPGQ